MRNNKGYVRGFDVRTGKRLWIFHTIPMQGRIRLRHLARTDRPNTPATPACGRRSRWTSSSAWSICRWNRPPATIYGGHRPGQQSLRRKPGVRGSEDRPAQVALPVRAPSALGHGYFLRADPRRHQRRTAAPSRPWRSPRKQGFLYVFDRVTGKPVWPIEERPVEKGDVPGEWYSPTQPFPTKPPALRAQRCGDRGSDRLHARAMHDQARP